MLHYTGHPFIDVGVATITAWSSRRDPADVTVEDLYIVANKLQNLFITSTAIQSYIRCFFPNSAFVQSNVKPEDVELYAKKVLYAFEDTTPVLDAVNCVFFTALPAVQYAYRQHVPLLNGMEFGNFSAQGKPGIPVSGLALLAIHAMPLGCIYCGMSYGFYRFLAFHQLILPSDNNRHSQLNLLLAKLALDHNLARKELAQAGDTKDIFLYSRYHRTLYVNVINRTIQTLRRRGLDIEQINRDITGYCFSNENRDPNLEIVRLDNMVLSFLDNVQQDALDSWMKVVDLGKAITPSNQEESSENTGEMERNYVYEALFDLPQRAVSFVKLLARGHDWNLITIFLRKVVNMQQDRINLYKKLGDKLAEYIYRYENCNRGFYIEFSRAKNSWELHEVIQRAAWKVYMAKSQEPLFTYEEFAKAFENPEDRFNQWKLAQTLISIRMLERMHEFCPRSSQEDTQDNQEFIEATEE